MAYKAKPEIIMFHTLRRRMLKDTKNITVTLYFLGSEMPTYLKHLYGRVSLLQLKCNSSINLLMRVFDWAKMQTIPRGVCFWWTVSFKWNQRVLQKVEGFETTRFISET